MHCGDPQDNGIGMSRDEVLQNLGTIAKSGSLEFLQKAGGEAGKDIIGQVRRHCTVVVPSAAGLVHITRWAPSCIACLPLLWDRGNA